MEILDESRMLVEGTSPFLFPNRVGQQMEEKQLRRMFRKVEAAYRRSDLFDRWRRLMDEWAAYLAGKPQESEADPIR